MDITDQNQTVIPNAAVPNSVPVQEPTQFKIPEPPPVIPNSSYVIPTRQSASGGKAGIFSSPFFIVLLILIVLVFGIYLGKTYFSSLNLFSKPTPIPTIAVASPSAMPTTDPTANWKTYTNQSHNFSLKYPANLTVLRDGDFAATFYDEKDISSNNPKFIPAKFEVSANNIGPDFNKYYNTPDNAVIPNVQAGAGETVIKIKNLTLDGQKAVQYVTQSQTSYTILTLTLYNSFYVTFYAGNGILKEDSLKLKPLYYQILSTFKFTSEATSSLPIDYYLSSGWKTVSDQTGVFEVGFDPSNTKAGDASVSSISLLKLKPSYSDWYSSFFSVSLKSYDGGSKKSFIYKEMGMTPSPKDLSPDYSEKEYVYNGKNCLFLNGISVSQFPGVWGVCDAGSGQVFLITSYDQSNFLTTVRTIKKLK